MQNRIRIIIEKRADDFIYTSEKRAGGHMGLICLDVGNGITECVHRTQTGYFFKTKEEAITAAKALVDSINGNGPVDTGEPDEPTKPKDPPKEGLEVGDEIEFEDKNGDTLKGEVVKITKKNAHMKVEGKEKPVLLALSDIE